MKTNTLESNVNDGIYIHESDNSLLEGNKANLNGSGIWLAPHSNKAELKSNVACYNKNSDFYNENYNERQHQHRTVQ